ncbi:putative inner membrane protein [Salmonella enterica subsp. enterica]|uniref:Putative inner membrane protein n=1 Tax=Salmonella enterica I TaxID=59201 RepID=A0A379VRN2_SALET|nr:putative inner membrane protein [Salmonella enterica subsp. enterica]
MGIRHFACRLAAKRGDAAVLLAAQAIRAVALGVVVTALVQAVLGGGRTGDFRRALRYPVDGSDDPFVSGSVGGRCRY